MLLLYTFAYFFQCECVLFDFEYFHKYGYIMNISVLKCICKNKNKNTIKLYMTLMIHKKKLNDYTTHETLNDVIDPYEIIDEIIEQ